MNLYCDNCNYFTIMKKHDKYPTFLCVNHVKSWRYVDHMMISVMCSLIYTVIIVKNIQ